MTAYWRPVSRARLLLDWPLSSPCDSRRSSAMPRKCMAVSTTRQAAPSPAFGILKEKSRQTSLTARFRVSYLKHEHSLDSVIVVDHIAELSDESVSRMFQFDAQQVSQLRSRYNERGRRHKAADDRCRDKANEESCIGNMLSLLVQ